MSKIKTASDNYLTRLISVNNIVPLTDPPNLFSEKYGALAEGGKNQPSILAKSRRPSF